MAEFPALPLFTDAIIADCHHLTDAEFGLYMRLLILMWRSPNCKIPNDPEWISRKISRPYSVVEPLLKEFCTNDGNYITQRRLFSEFNYVKKLSQVQSVRAKSRWNKKKDPCPSDATLHASGNAPIPIPIPIIKEKNNIKKERIKKQATRLPPDWKLPQADGMWAEAQGYTPQEIITMATTMHDWALSKNVAKADWHATWRNWVRRNLEQKRK